VLLDPADEPRHRRRLPACRRRLGEPLSSQLGNCRRAPRDGDALGRLDAQLLLPRRDRRPGWARSPCAGGVDVESSTQIDLAAKASPDPVAVLVEPMGVDLRLEPVWTSPRRLARDRYRLVSHRLAPASRDPASAGFVAVLDGGDAAVLGDGA
jgi:hypothetical protein